MVRKTQFETYDTPISVWDRILDMEPTLRDMTIYALEVDFAENRAREVRSRVQQVAEVVNDPKEVIDIFGGKEELERQVGPAYRHLTLPKDEEAIYFPPKNDN